MPGNTHNDSVPSPAHVEGGSEDHGPRQHRFLALASESLGRKDAEDRVMEGLRAYGATTSKKQLLKGEKLTLKPRSEAAIVTNFGALVAGTRATGVVPEVDRMRWRDADPYGSIACATDSALPIVLGTGPRASPPCHGPGYVTNNVIVDMVEDVLFYRSETVKRSSVRDQFKLSFRAFRAYLATSVTTVDSFLNRCAWFGLHDPKHQLTPDAERTLRNQRLPLDAKLRRWLPILCAGHVLDETGAAWSDYQSIKKARNAFVHVNEPDHSFVLRDVAKDLNRCRLGVGQLLIDMTLLLGRRPLPDLFALRFAPLVSFVEIPR